MSKPWSVGSQWMRWDPHLHAPGTLRHNLYGDDWEGYLTAIEQAQPAPVALGITDYLCMRTYRRVLEYRRNGRLSGIELVFPNIELRLTVETKRGDGINLHLLICPDQADHVERTERFLSRLQFPFQNDVFNCSEAELERLGRAHQHSNAIPADKALSDGANQFKVNWRELQKLRGDDAWARQNILIAVAAGEDGLAGIGKDAGFDAERQNLGAFADIIFSGSPSDRTFWCGNHPDFAAKGYKPKPCLHGSDAHDILKVLNPDKERRCWIRSEPTFDGLRQTLVEPERRVHIGPHAPERTARDHVIRRVTLQGAPWMLTSPIELNGGLVAIIGAKGSGKTAIADLTAFGAYADDDEPSAASFLRKAERLLLGTEISIEWGDGTNSVSKFPRPPAGKGQPRVRYLSQQFVERLCSATDVAQPLVEEIESVVFAAISEDKRCQCEQFDELRELTLSGILARRHEEREIIRALTHTIAEERKVHSEQASLEKKLAEVKRSRLGYEAELKTIPLAADQQLVTEHQATYSKLTALRAEIAAQERRGVLLKNLLDEIQRDQRSADNQLLTKKPRFGGLLTEDQWELLRFTPDEKAVSTVQELQRKCRTTVSQLKKTGLASEGLSPSGGQWQGLEELETAEKRLADKLGVDKANARRRVELTNRLVEIRKDEEQMNQRLEHAKGAVERIASAGSRRLEEYERVFQTLVEEEDALLKLYEPLKASLGTAKRLSFYVQRRVDTNVWAAEGERLLDLRRSPFGGRGEIAKSADVHLVEAWTVGKPDKVREAMTAFLKDHSASMLGALASGATPEQLGDWLFRTDHIHMEYGIKYEDTMLSQLSPGTRGVVLLTLFLDLDRWDERPLIIDQPEENLDPKSVYSELVPFFREAAKRRQIIIVTHNANLVVNTDADQVIIASSERTGASSLPNFEYTAGGLEDPRIREQVCALLEGGADAFRKRSQRYGVWG